MTNHISTTSVASPLSSDKKMMTTMAEKKQKKKKAAKRKAGEKTREDTKRQRPVAAPDVESESPMSAEALARKNLILAADNNTHVQLVGTPAHMGFAKELLEYARWAARAIALDPKQAQEDHVERHAIINAKVAANNFRIAYFNHARCAKSGPEDLLTRTREVLDNTYSIARKQATVIGESK